MTARQWRTASACSNEGNCVEVAAWRTACGASNTCVQAGRVLGDGRVAVRDSADPEGPVLVLTPAAWRELLDQVKGADRG